MWVLILVLGVAGLYNTEAMQSFSKHRGNVDRPASERMLATSVVTHSKAASKARRARASAQITDGQRCIGWQSRRALEQP